jgi:putative phosphoribosyl transferase
MFPDRISAGRLLARHLVSQGTKRPVVLALPRGGVPVAAAVADALNAPLDVILVRKIGAPHQPELAIGAVAEGERPVVELDDDAIELPNIPDSYVAAEEARQWAEILRRRAFYAPSRQPVTLNGRTVIIVDDGIATGATMQAAIAAARQRGAAEIVVAVPTASREALAEMQEFADRIVCLESQSNFIAVGAHYEDFAQISDDAVRDHLARFASRAEPQSAAL